MTLDLTYRAGRDKGLTGSGRVVDISSAGIHFTTAHTLPLQAPVELTVVWPVMLERTVCLKLVVRGFVVRSSAADASVIIEKYEFRTHRRQLLGLVTR